MDTEGNTVMNAVTGAVVTLVLSFLPLAPVVGGAVGGYLQRGARGDGATVGGVVGLLVTLPLFVALLVVVPVVVLAPAGVVVVPGNGVVFALALLAGTLVYAVAPGVIGGVVGRYLAIAGAE